MVKLLRFALAAAAAALLSGCAWFGGGSTSQPAAMPKFKPLSTALNGQYRLIRVSGQPLPSLRKTQDGCRVELDSGTLSIYGRRFDLTATTRRFCGDSIVSSTLHHVSGRYQRKGKKLSFKVDQGHFFDSAQGMLADHRVRLLSLHRLSSGRQPIDWVFKRHAKQAPPSPLKAL